MANIDIELANGQKAGETLKQLRFQAAALNKEISTLKPGTEEFVRASTSLNQVKDRMSGINDQIKSTSKASAQLKNSWDTLFPGISAQMKFLTGQFAAAKAGVGGLISQFGMMKIALAAIPIAAAVLALSSFSAWLKRTDEGAMFLEGKMNQLSGTIDVLTGRLIKLGSENFFAALMDGLEEAFVMGDVMASWADSLDDLRRETELFNAESEKQVNQLLLQSKNVGLSLQERLDLLDKAGMLEAEAHEKKREYHEQVIEMINVEMKQAEKNGQVGDDLKDKLNDALIERTRLDQESITVQEKITNRRSALLDKEQSEKDQAARKDEQRMQKEEAAAQKREAEELAAIERKKRANDEYRDWETTMAAFHLAKIQNLATASLEKALAAIKEKMTAQAEANAEEAKSDEDLYKRKLEWLKQHEQAEGAAREQLLASGVSLSNALFAIEIQKAKDRIAQSNDNEALRKREAERIRKYEAARVRIQMLAEIATIWRHAADFGPLQTILAGIQTASALARGKGAIQSINSQQFEAGGAVLRGRSHAQGGIPIEAEGDEIIMTKGVYRNQGLRAMASAINAAGGGRRFEMGGPVNPFVSNDRAPVPSAASQAGAKDPFAEITGLRNDFRAYADRVDQWASSLSVQNNLSDVRKGIATLNKLEGDANV